MQEMEEMQVGSLGWEDPLEKGTATHPSTLAWRIPWTEEPGGLSSIGSHRVGHNWSDLAAAAAYYICILCIIYGASQVVLVVKKLPAKAGDVRDAGWIPGLGRSPGEGHGNPLHYSYLENPIDRGAWQATVWRVRQDWSNLAHILIFTYRGGK